MPFQFRALEIPDVILIEPTIYKDDRGYFIESYKKSAFYDHGITVDFVQDNHSHSTKGVLRGLHYQKEPRAQAKLVRALSGKIFDAVVDIRQGSPTFGKWVGEILSAENGRMLFVPPGFAHGFCVLSNEADIFYKVTEEYAPEYDRGIIWNDPDIAIDWPIAAPLLSAKDSQLPSLKQADNNFVYQ